MSLILGVDGGNSKTIALLARMDGTIVGSGRSGCADIYLAPSEGEALAEIDRAVTAALREAEVMAAEVQTAVFSLAGADWPEDKAFLRQEMLRRGFGRTVEVVNDAFGTLRAGVSAGPAVAVNCGTGAAIAARGLDGRVWHTSFWSEPMGGWAMGEQTLRAVYRAELGIDPPTALTAPVLAIYKQEQVEDLLHLFTRRLTPPPRNLATLARLLLDVAGQGDTAACVIVRRQAELLGEYALAAARRVGIAAIPFPLVLAGGIFRHHSAILAEAVVARVQAAAPGAWLVQRHFEPVAGALLLALERANAGIDDGLLARLAASMPPGHFFTT